MAKYPTKAKKTVKPKIVKHDIVSLRPMAAIVRAVYNSSEKRAANKANQKENVRFNKEDKAYQSSLKEMGATVNGGGRANVRPAGASNPATQKGTPKSGKK